MKLIYTAALSMIALASLCGCGGSGSKADCDSLRSDSVITTRTGDYSSVMFRNAGDVLDFIDFRKFVTPEGYLAFHGKGGVMDGEGFSVTEVKVTGDRSAELFIHIPKADLSGRLLLTVADDDVSILDEETKTTYRIQPIDIDK